ncbi:hypothetical protein [Komagataeibacter phage phiKX2]|nr:hypothetical protein [Komagataeibacter phage phiKX2]
MGGEVAVRADMEARSVPDVLDLLVVQAASANNALRAELRKLVDHLAYRRRGKRITLACIAAEIGCSAAFASSVEIGKKEPSVAFVRAYQKALSGRDVTP